MHRSMPSRLTLPVLAVALASLAIRYPFTLQYALEIVDAETRQMPYPGLCDQHGNAYGRLVGLNLLKGFRAAVKERLGGVQGCTHISEMGQLLPTAVIQAFVGEVTDARESADTGRRPFQIDGCHALRADGEAVRTHYPRWYRSPKAGSPDLADHFSPTSSESPR